MCPAVQHGAGVRRVADHRHHLHLENHPNCFNCFNCFNYRNCFYRAGRRNYRC